MIGIALMIIGSLCISKSSIITQADNSNSLKLNSIRFLINAAGLLIFTIGIIMTMIIMFW